MSMATLCLTFGSFIFIFLSHKSYDASLACDILSIIIFYELVLLAAREAPHAQSAF